MNIYVLTEHESMQVSFCLHILSDDNKLQLKRPLTFDLCVSPGRPSLIAGRRRLHRVRGDSVRLGAAAHLAGRLLLQGPAAASGQGQCSFHAKINPE